MPWEALRDTVQNHLLHLLCLVALLTVILLGQSERRYNHRALAAA